MQRDDTVKALMEQAEKLGLRFEFDSGLVLVKRPHSADPDRQETIFAKLARYLPDVRQLVELRASGVRAKDFIGARIWSANGAGTLVEGNEDGTLTVRLGAEMRRSNESETRQQLSDFDYRAESLLVVVNSEDTAGATASGDEPTSEQQSGKGFFQRLRGG